MCDSKKVPIIVPEDISWPADLPIPEIEVVDATIRKTKIMSDGTMQETIKTVDLPLIPDND